MTLQVFFFVLSIYGWVVWLTNREGSKVRPTRTLTWHLLVILGLILIAVTLIWGYVLKHFTDASIPYADAFIATLSLVAQYLISSKVLENWLCWVVVDVLSVAMYLYKGLNAVAFLYVIFLIIAAAGYFSWKRELQIKERSESICSSTKQA